MGKEKEKKIKMMQGWELKPEILGGVLCHYIEKEWTSKKSFAGKIIYSYLNTLSWKKLQNTPGESSCRILEM